MSILFSVTLPVFGLILCGFIAGRIRVLGDAATDGLNGFVYYFALPALLLHSVAKAPLTEIFDWRYLGAVFGGLVITLAITALLSKTFYGDGLSVLTLRAVSAAFANTGYVGIPLAITAFGQVAAVPAIMATVINSMVIGLAAAMIELDQRKSGIGPLASVGRTLATNPLILAVVIGGGVAFSGTAVPQAIGTFLDLLGAAAGPCALFALGLFASQQRSKDGRFADTMVLTALKLIVHPAVTWGLAILVFGLNEMSTAIAVTMAALPTGALVFVLAQRYQVFVRRASSTILLTTVVSLITVTVVLNLLGSVG
ncbi:MAG: AEC family transporter [Alphaproteobacteria bacterium]